jgi:bacterioferritin
MKETYTKEQLLKDVADDLAHEYMHMNCYLMYASTVCGLHRQELREFYLEEAASEMKHVTQFTDKLIGLGGTPTFRVEKFPDHLWTPKEQLEQILRMEEDRVAMYDLRMQQCEELGGPDGSTMHVFYENQIDDSRNTVDHVRQLLRGV